MKETFRRVALKLPKIHWKKDPILSDEIRRFVTISFTVEVEEERNDVIETLAGYAVHGHQLNVTLESPQASFNLVPGAAETPRYSGPSEIGPGAGAPLSEVHVFQIPTEPEFRSKITFDRV